RPCASHASEPCKARHATKRAMQSAPSAAARGAAGESPAAACGPPLRYERYACSSGLRLRLLLDLRTQLFFLGAQLRRELLTKILGLEDRPNRYLGAAIERRALQPFDRFFNRLDLPNPVASDKLLGLGKRAVDDRALRAIEL